MGDLIVGARYIFKCTSFLIACANVTIHVCISAQLLRMSVSFDRPRQARQIDLKFCLKFPQIYGKKYIQIFFLPGF